VLDPVIEIVKDWVSSFFVTTKEVKLLAVAFNALVNNVGRVDSKEASV